MHNFSAPEFSGRHIGPRADDVAHMLQALDLPSLDALVQRCLPPSIRWQGGLTRPPVSEHDLLQELRWLAAENRPCTSFLGQGYYGTITPAVIARNVLENPGWYTQYTPYQAEISQGRLEALFNFQTLVCEMTGLSVANASLLDEATAAAEAMVMCAAIVPRLAFYVFDHCHPQTLAVVETRAAALGITILRGDGSNLAAAPICGALLQYPDTLGRVWNTEETIARIHALGALAVVATDLLALTLIRPAPADIAIGSSQRFGVPIGYGGPHAAFLATRQEWMRRIPGRIVGLSRDADGNPALRLAMQTREQHIRRERATSNICTAQVLLAVMASMYAVYHGPHGLRRIALRIAHLARRLGGRGFDTVHIHAPAGTADRCREAGLLVRTTEQGIVASCDETTSDGDVDALLAVVGPQPEGLDIPEGLRRGVDFLQQPTFNAYHSETAMLRYMHSLEQKDLSLNTSMIPLGSCTMKLNATTEMLALSMPGFADLHPYAPEDCARGYRRIIDELCEMIQEITGFPGVSLQPNAGSQGEYAGLLAIRGYHGRARDVCLIPTSAHGTNPASAAMAGMQVVPVACDAGGNVDLADLASKAARHRDRLAAMMVTYPSTHGVFEDGVQRACQIVHEHGGLVYLDGANLTAMVGLARPADLGADVCHLNLHKTFAIPHGGGGPGMGPIAVAAHLVPHLPGFPQGAVAAAPYSSASILTISWAYMRMMGGGGLTMATKIAILNANYMAAKLMPSYDVLYRGSQGLVAHEFILDFRKFKRVSVEDVAKRLMDYGFHAPTMAWPVAGTLMIEPTESEDLGELDRFCEALIAIRAEIEAVESGLADSANNVLRRAPHTAQAVCSDLWDRPYSREQAAFPLRWLRGRKFWPSVARVDNAHGDRNLVCNSCA
jgi:glycine dehydrogenase